MSQTTQTSSLLEPSLEIEINEKARTAVVGYLNAILADEFVLYTKTRNYHWNVVGANFYALHQFFEAQSVQLNENVDEIAERVRAIGGRPSSSLAEFLAGTRIVEEPPKSTPAKEMVGKLLADHESLIRLVRADLVRVTKPEDAGTADFLARLLESHEKMAWMLRATAPAQTAAIKA
jgi:starvation-inducible DNA-binding protein